MASPGLSALKNIITCSNMYLEVLADVNNLVKQTELVTYDQKNQFECVMYLLVLKLALNNSHKLY